MNKTLTIDFVYNPLDEDDVREFMFAARAHDTLDVTYHDFKLVIKYDDINDVGEYLFDIGLTDNPHNIDDYL